jgi:hypothetical protein
MPKRKTSEDYRKEYSNLLEKTKALEVRIKERVLELCKTYPEAPTGDISTGRDILIFLEDGGYLNMFKYIDIIGRIEKYNAERSGVVQTKIEYPDEK